MYTLIFIALLLFIFLPYYVGRLCDSLGAVRAVLDVKEISRAGLWVFGFVVLLIVAFVVLVAFVTTESIRIL